jgi:hypothetical protein
MNKSFQDLEHDDMTDGIRRRTVESLESAADSVRAAGVEGSGAISDLAHETGERLDSSAAYVRTFAGGDVLASLRDTVQRNLAGSLVVAASAGLVAGLSLRAFCRPSQSGSDAKAAVAK